jgi:hypothetical protein
MAPFKGRPRSPAEASAGTDLRLTSRIGDPAAYCWRVPEGERLFCTLSYSKRRATLFRRTSASCRHFGTPQRSSSAERLAVAASDVSEQICRSAFILAMSLIPRVGTI